jgi:hypothetical protein
MGARSWPRRLCGLRRGRWPGARTPGAIGPRSVRGGPTPSGWRPTGLQRRVESRRGQTATRADPSPAAERGHLELGYIGRVKAFSELQAALC